MSGPTIPGPASLRRRYEISSEPKEALFGKDLMIFLTSAGQISWIVNTDFNCVGPIGKPSRLRQVFWLIKV